MRSDNPYVGPRSLRAGEALYGRDRELGELLDLVIAERVVLLHSPSGAGKTSLLQAALIPRLRAEGFVVRPIARVGQELPAGAPAGANRYALSLLLSLAEDVPADRQRPLAELAHTRLVDYLDATPADAEVLILDQFEEVLTADANDHAAKRAFFTELGEALRSPRRWCVVAVREDYAAALAPYTRLLPTRLRTTFRLDLLGAAGALEAVQRPARDRGVDFIDAAAHKLVDDLRQVRVQSLDGQTRVELGPSIEPVQLQVACRSLWDSLPPGDVYVDEGDLRAIGDVDAALAGFYEQQVHAVVTQGLASERDLRRWFERQLITEQGLRGQVMRTAEASGGLANAAIAALVDGHVVRGEARRGSTWYELAHDRLVAPIRASNTRWAAASVDPVQRQAELWDSQSRPDALLLADLPEATRLLAVAAQRTALERTFLERSVALRQREAREQALRRRTRHLLIGSVLTTLVALIAVVAVLKVRADAEHARSELEAEGRRAAESATRLALARQLAGDVLQLPETQIDLAALLAITADQLAPGWDGRTTVLAALTRVPHATALLPLPPFDPHRQFLIDSGAAQSLAVSTDGTTLAAIDHTGVLTLWDLAARTARTTDRVEQPGVVAQFSPRGPLLTLDADGGIGLWDPTSGHRTGRLFDSADESTTTGGTLSLSARGDRLAVVSNAHPPSVWDVDSNKRLATTEQDAISVAMHPQGQLVAIGLRLAAVTLWDPGDNTLHDPENSRGDAVTPIQFTRDGKTLVGIGEHDAFTWSVDVAARTLTLRDQRPHGVDQARASSLVDGDRFAALVCTDTCARLAIRRLDLATHRGWSTPVTLPDAAMLPRGDFALQLLGGDRVAIGGVTVGARILDLAPAAPLRAHPMGPQVLAVSPNSQRFATAGCSTETLGTCTGSTVQTWDLATRTPVRPDPLVSEAAIVALGFAADSTLSSVGADGSLIRWDLSSGTSTHITSLPAPITAATFTADATRVAAANIATIHVHTLPTNTTLELAGPALGVFALEFAGTTLAASGCGPLVASACTGELRLWDLATTTPPRILSSPDFFTTFALSPKTATLAVATAAGRVFFDTSGTQRDLPIARQSHIAALAFSADGELLMTMACPQFGCPIAESELRLWRVDTLRELGLPLRGHAPDERSAEDHASLMFQRHLAWTADGDRVITTSVDGAVVWDLAVADLERRACTLAGRNPTPAEWLRHVGNFIPYTAPCPG